MATESAGSIAAQAILDIPEYAPAIPGLIADAENIGGAHGTGIVARLEALESFAMQIAETFGNLFPKETGVAKVLDAAGTVATVAAGATAAAIPAVEAVAKE